MVRGAWYLTKIPKPIVSIFGGGKLLEESHYFEKAIELSQRFAHNNISVLTGGGPGAMEAANRGALTQDALKGKSIGIGVKGLEKRPNEYTNQYFELHHFFARKWLLTHYSQGFIIFPGGYGTLDELTEVLTLIVTKRIEKVPIILIGTEYWGGLFTWMENESVTHGLIDKEALTLMTITNDLDLAFNTIQEMCLSKQGTCS